LGGGVRDAVETTRGRVRKETRAAREREGARDEAIRGTLLRNARALGNRSGGRRTHVHGEPLPGLGAVQELELDDDALHLLVRDVDLERVEHRAPVRLRVRLGELLGDHGGGGKRQAGVRREK
jgi:hypothetical protein